MCLKNPQSFYRLASSDPIVFVFFNVSLDQSYGVAYKKLQTALMMSPWFLEHGEVTGLRNKEYHPGKNIEFRVGSQTSHSIGQNVFCVTGDTKIITDSGVKSISEIANCNNPVAVACYDEKSDKLLLSNMCRALQTGQVTDLIEITLEDGSIIRCTEDHRLLLSNNTYKFAKDLVVGDDLKSFDNLNLNR